MVIAAVKLKPPLQTSLLTTFHQLVTMHENYHIFTSSPSCYASVIKQNVNSIILISWKDIARIVKTSLVKTVKSWTALPKRNFRAEFFSGNFQSNCSFKMFWEEHYHMTLSSKTPPQRFSRERDMFRLFFGSAIS